jgi:type I restriction enzyme S subunit
MRKSGANGNLSSVCEFIVDCEHKTAPTEEEGYPSIRTPNIGRGRLILDGVNRVSEETYRLWTRRAIPEANDLILAREAPIGNVAIIPENLKVCLGQRTVLIRPDKTKVDPHYLVNLLLGDEIQARIQSMAAGVTVGHLNVKDIRELALPKLPSLHVQRKIAAILSAYDDLIENNTRRIKILEEMAQTIYREWFVEFCAPNVELRKATLEEHKLTGKDVFPKGWEVKKLIELVDVQKGIKPENTYEEPGNGRIRYLLLEGIESGKYLYTDDRRVAIAVQDDVVMVMDGARSGLVFIGISGAVGSTLGYFRPKRKAGFSPFVLYLFFKGRFTEIASKNVGAAIPHANKAFILGMDLVLPPEEINQAIHDMVAPPFKQIQNLKAKNTILRRTRDLLLPKLISGEVAVEKVDIEAKGGL